ncbi:hypothetical protein LWC35_36980 [Pseudonocardia kujensis]|uniref:hypothetical protein n=1 Tax=Pseudonocardia kujensis TaxID=1128675 RepID=UPI001E2C7E85|nr:hypothetical protein [Pseudonocardia kujensis]MCE0768448.1 hypothetical protein [Pseudonocardia kujensis]
MGFRVAAKTIGCEGGNCPTTYIDEEGSVIVQGYRTSIAGRLRFPMELLDRHARAEGRDSWGRAHDRDRGRLSPPRRP